MCSVVRLSLFFCRLTPVGHDEVKCVFFSAPSTTCVFQLRSDVVPTRGRVEVEVRFFLPLFVRLSPELQNGEKYCKPL